MADSKFAPVKVARRLRRLGVAPEYGREITLIVSRLVAAGPLTARRARRWEPRWPLRQDFDSMIGHFFHGLDWTWRKETSMTLSISAQAAQVWNSLPQNEESNLIEDFNPSFYAQTHPGVPESGAFNDFLVNGLKQGDTSINPNFDNTYYLNANPDVALAVANGQFASGLEHYLAYGQNLDNNGAGRQANASGAPVTNDLFSVDLNTQAINQDEIDLNNQNAGF